MSRREAEVAVGIGEAGEEETISRYGNAVARLVPPEGTASPSAAREAAQRIRKMRKGVTLGGLKLKDLVDEGRR